MRRKYTYYPIIHLFCSYRNRLHVRIGTRRLSASEQRDFHYTMVTTCLRVSVLGSFSSLEPVELWVVTLSS